MEGKIFVQRRGTPTRMPNTIATMATNTVLIKATVFRAGGNLLVVKAY